MLLDLDSTSIALHRIPTPPDPAFPIVVDPPSPRGFSTVAPVRTLRRAVLVDRSAYLGALRSLSSCESPLHVRISPTPARFSIVIRCAGIGLGEACLLTTVLKTCLLFLAGDRSPSWTLPALVSRPASASLPIIIIVSAPLCTSSLPQPCTGALTVAIPR